MDRVSLDQNALKISKAGVDVKYATQDQLLFSSERTQFLEYDRQVHASPSPWDHVTTGPNQGWFLDYDISFAKTFPAVPLCMIYVSFGVVGETYLDNKTYCNMTLGALNLLTPRISISALVHDSKISVQAGQSDAPSPIEYTLKYRVLEQTN